MDILKDDAPLMLLELRIDDDDGYQNVWFHFWDKPKAAKKKANEIIRAINEGIIDFGETAYVIKENCRLRSVKETIETEIIKGYDL